MKKLALLALLLFAGCSSYVCNPDWGQPAFVKVEPVEEAPKNPDEFMRRVNHYKALQEIESDRHLIEMCRDCYQWLMDGMPERGVWERTPCITLDSCVDLYEERPELFEGATDGSE